MKSFIIYQAPGLEVANIKISKNACNCYKTSNVCFSSSHPHHFPARRRSCCRGFSLWLLLLLLIVLVFFNSLAAIVVVLLFVCINEALFSYWVCFFFLWVFLLYNSLGKEIIHKPLHFTHTFTCTHSHENTSTPTLTHCQLHHLYLHYYQRTLVSIFLRATGKCQSC